MKPALIIQNCEAEAPGTIIDYMAARQISYQVIHSWRGEAFPDASEFSAVICLGCPISMTDYDRHPFLVNLYAYVSGLVRADVPYLGICYGGQLLASVLGAKVGPNKLNEIGTYRVRLTEAGKLDPLFAGLGSSFPVVQWHGDTFAIPFGCQLLVEGTDCVNQAFRRGRQVALQFHLEVTESLLQTWCETYPAELLEVEKSVAEMLRDFRIVADTLKQMNFAFLDSFFSLAKGNQPTNHTPPVRLDQAH